MTLLDAACSQNVHSFKYPEKFPASADGVRVDTMPAGVLLSCESRLNAEYCARLRECDREKAIGDYSCLWPNPVNAILPDHNFEGSVGNCLSVRSFGWAYAEMIGNCSLKFII